MDQANPSGSGSFLRVALPNADVIAFVRNVGTKDEPVNIPNVFWVGQDQILYQTIAIPNGSGYHWTDAVAIDKIGETGQQAGSWEGGSHFSDEDADDAETDRVIGTVRVRATADRVVALALEFTDGSTTGWRGGDGGEEHALVLQPGEDIWQVLYHADERRVLGLRFRTSKGTLSPWFGNETEKPREWVHEGAALEGFSGTASADGLLGLTPLWSDRLSYATLENINDMLTEGERLKKEVEELSQRLPGLEASAADLSQRIAAGYSTRAKDTMDAFVQLATDTEYLHDLTHAARRAHLGAEDARRRRDLDAQLKVCQDQTTTLLKHVDALNTTAIELGALSNKVHTKVAEIDAEVKTVEARLARLLDRTGRKAKKLESQKTSYRRGMELSEKELENLKARLASLQQTHEYQQTARSPSGDSSSEEDDDDADDKARSRPLFLLPRKLVTEADLTAAAASVEEQRASLASYRTVLADTDAALTKCTEAHAGASALLAEAARKTGALHPVVEQDATLRASAGTLAGLLVRLRASSVAMEDNTTAGEYAEELLVVLADLSAIEVLKGHLPRERATVVTKVLRGIANFMY